MSLLNCGCCSNVHQYIAEHIDPSGTIEAKDRPEEIMAQINEMYAETPEKEKHPVTLDDVRSYIERIRFPAKSPRKPIEEDRVCPECYANVRCDCE